MLGVQGLQAAEVAVSCSPTHLYGEADQPVRQQTTAVHEEIHHIGVVRVLHSAQTRLNHGESGLHEHDQEAANQCPGKVNPDLVLPHLVGDIARSESSFGV